ncbi:hypothetical protein [Spiroplasma diminutum]|uniref:Uncharacterized protein n=1 Tax=Spiroplasma diminutum CUAS-1 TaxID=1276221 RepID=S5M2W9_9MOLU|nr:hypothetical protein [Spiroplasma diminutum]AGR42427.1 hypothetical protein SDIMI_v3c07230 [Spiroplasma diminutum CUAS-1]
MDENNKNDLIQGKDFETEQTKKRLDEIKNSNILINSKIAANNFYVPKRKERGQESDQVALIKPRKKKNLPFTDEQQKEIEETMTNIQTEYKQIEKSNRTFEKKLFKEELKISRLISKTNKKIGSLIAQENEEELEKTVKLQAEYLRVFDKIHDDIDTIILRDNKISLGDRRKHIYNNAYNAETERARKLVELRNKNKSSWSNQIKNELKVEPKRSSDNWMERLGILDDDE